MSAFRDMMTAPDADDPALLAEGFVSSPRFAGCLIKQAHDGQYVVFRPIDCKSGKFEMYYQTTDNRLRVDFPPATARGIVRHVRKHEVRS